MYLTQALHRGVQLYPERAVLRFSGLERSFSNFADRVARLAGALQKLGMKEGDRVAILSLNSDKYLEYQMAVPWGGGVLNPCNIRWTAAEIAYSLNDSGSTILLVDEAFRPLVSQFRHEVQTLREVIYCGNGVSPENMHDYEKILAEATPIPDVVRRGDDLAGIFYTGGTTGFPKGVMLSHNNLCCEGLTLCSEGYATPGSVYLHAAPMFHLGDMGASVAQWTAGNTHSIIPAFNPEAVLKAIEHDRVNITLWVPTMIQMLLDHPAMQQSRDISSLKTIAYGASPISEALLDRAMERLPQVEFIHSYGMTELSSSTTILHPHFHFHENRKLGKLRSVGRANYMSEIRIVDNLGNEVTSGISGEIVVRGPQVMKGYWNKPEETAAAIRNGWMHTGDVGYMDNDGFIFVVDRIKDMIISGGENVYSVEVENAISQHPAVAACAVIGIPSNDWGEAVHAVVMLKPDQTLSHELLVSHCKTLIAGYKCPRSVAIVDALPISGAGKILKTKLREPFWQDNQRKIS